MTERYTTLSHTADTGIEASGATLAQLIEHLAYGMFDLMHGVAALPRSEPVRFEVATGPPTELLMDVLSELLYRSEALDQAYDDISVTIGTDATEIEAVAASTADAALEGPPIKAVTYHDLVVEQLDDGTWRGRVIFDV